MDAASISASYIRASNISTWAQNLSQNNSIAPSVINVLESDAVPKAQNFGYSVLVNALRAIQRADATAVTVQEIQQYATAILNELVGA